MFNIYDPLTYDEVPDGIAVIDGEISYTKDGNPFTWKEIVKFAQSFFRIGNEDINSFPKEKYIKFINEFFSPKVQRINQIQIDKEKQQKEKELEYLLNHLEEITKDNPFNPYDINTFKYADPKKILVVDGVAVYDRNITQNGKHPYLYETDVEKHLSIIKKIHSIPELNYDSTPLVIDNEYLKNFYHEHFWECFEKPVTFSNETYNNYTFTIPQLLILKHQSTSVKIKVTEIINQHFNEKRPKYRLKQEIFSCCLNINYDYLTDLCYAKTLEDEQKIVFMYDTDTILLNCLDVHEYTKNKYYDLYPDFKQKVIAYVKEKEVPLNK